MTISASLVKELRDKTGAGMMDCKKALVEANGDMDAAVDVGIWMLVLAVAIGFALANAFGERGANQEITGFDPGDDARIVLASARDALNENEFALANGLFARVVQMERDREIDNVEAINEFQNFIRADEKASNKAKLE